jgi:hypothetical protein
VRIRILRWPGLKAHTIARLANGMNLLTDCGLIISQYRFATRRDKVCKKCRAIDAKRPKSEVPF